MFRASRGLAFALTFAACSVVTAPAVPFRHIGSGAFSAFSEQQVVVVRSAAEWETAQRQLGFGLHDAPRAIDFASEAAVIVALGTRPTSGYTVQVDEVRRRNGRYEVIAVELTPGSCATAQVLTTPFEVIAIPRDADRVDVSWSSRARGACD
ncbi:MAG TPA: protease complex subunit PrcB family protein [Vicinamibacterales bacterium]|nr:protease complex subunit PrcB family protein [Vicinamibacterales bacterium]